MARELYVNVRRGLIQTDNRTRVLKRRRRRRRRRRREESCQWADVPHSQFFQGVKVCLNRKGPMT
jgi:hypothetical protein